MSAMVQAVDPLDALEQRVLGVLIEKSLATPEQYPLSLHALVAGCNQKSNRDPLMLVSEPEVRLTIEGLRQKHLAGVTHPAGGRVERYVHAAAETLGLPKPSLAVLAELLVRGPQARGELRGRASRMVPIATLEELGEVLERLEAKGLVATRPPAPGSRAPRVGHLLGGAEEESAAPIAAGLTPPGLQPRIATPSGRSVANAGNGGPELAARVAQLEEELAALRAELATVRGRLTDLAEKLGEPL
jgi:hypothetical protein